MPRHGEGPRGAEPRGPGEHDRSTSSVARRRSLGDLLALLEDARELAAEVVGADRLVLEAIAGAAQVVRDSTTTAARAALAAGDVDRARRLTEEAIDGPFDAAVSALLDQVLMQESRP